MTFRIRYFAPLACLLAVVGCSASVHGQGEQPSAPSPKKPVLMAEFSTTYPNSPPDRNYNLALAASKISGTVVPPGGLFSFNQTLGPAERAQGFRKAGVFVGNRIVQGYGGGVCQVSSTLYNAVVRAGLKVVQRRPHPMTVPYLPPGHDATIAYPYFDLKFRNTTSEPVRIGGEGQGETVRFRLFGVRKGPETRFETKILGKRPFSVVRIKDATLEAGEEKVAQGGLEGVTVHTWIHQKWPDGRETTQDLGVARYRPSPRVILVGTGHPKPSKGRVHSLE